VTAREVAIEDVREWLTATTCVVEAVTPADETWVENSATAAESVPTALKALDDTEDEESTTESAGFLISAPTSLRRKLDLDGKLGPRALTSQAS
jgi:hypothetical protein